MDGTIDMGDQMNFSTNAHEDMVGLHVDLATLAHSEEEREPPSSMDASELHAPCCPASAHASPATAHCTTLEDNKLSSSPSFFHGLGEGKVPLWIKWRGKWQAGLQCSLEDCPGQTIKAMPTYGRKSYIVVFFPNSRSFVWTDWQLVCPISENPEPLAFGTHESGRNSVADLNGARQCMLRKLAAQLLDISDRLPVQAVVDCARDVTFWKDFAKDAAKAATYQELGALLVKLKNMILPTFIKGIWSSDLIQEWKCQCESVETAGSMEKLANELKSSVVWDEVSKLWDELEQTNLGSEWKTWKEDVNRNNFNESNSSITGHRRPFDPTDCTPEGSDGHARSTDAGLEDSEQGCKRVKMEEYESVPSLPESMEGILVKRGIGKNAYILSLSAVANNTRNWGSRLSSGAVVDPVAPLDEQSKGKLPLVDAGGDDSNGAICVGTTKFGRRCTHKARDGSKFCLKHMFKIAGTENSAGASVGNTEFQINSPEKHSDANLKRKLEPASTSESNQASFKASKFASKIAARIANGMRCVGWCRKRGKQCSHRAKPGFSFCEKHLPNVNKKGQGKTHAKPAPAGTLDRENDECYTRLKELVNAYIKARIEEDGAQSSQHVNYWQKLIDSILLEVDGNLKASESLHNLISSEMESLKSLFEQDAEEVQRNHVPLLTKPVEQGSCSMPAKGEEVSLQHLSNVELLKHVSKSTGHMPRFRCKLCAQEFVELHVLGQHWRACHKKEAQQYFRGYACQHCNLPFTNKKGLYRHRNSHHPGMSSQNKSSLIALCVICSGQFMNFEDLWQHVIRSHPDQLCAVWPVISNTGSALDPWKAWGLEAVDFTKCLDCDAKFVTYAELQQHRETSHKDNELGYHMESLRRTSNSTDELKYKCKVCGLRFRLLPDLGRHHQAEHKPAQVMQLMSVKRDALLSGPLEELNSIIGAEKERKKLQKLNVRRAPGGQLKTEVPSTVQQSLAPDDQNVTDLEGYTGPKLEGLPDNEDILAVAKFACCKNKLYTVLLKKYISLPDRLALKAAKLCSEANVRLDLCQEGYVCPNGCKDVNLVLTDSKSIADLSFPYANCASLLPQLNQPVADNRTLLKSEDIVLDESQTMPTAAPDGKENLNNTVVLCEDLSFGKERVPIPCVVDIHACSDAMCVDNQSSHSEALMPWLHFTYVTKRTLDPSLGLDTESSRLGCSCQGFKCSPAQCEHVYIFDNDNTDAQDIYGQPMAGRFPYDIQGCIVLEEGYPVYECNSICSCHETCQNRVLQKGVQVKLEVYKTRHKGWAVRAAQQIKRGTFVCEYIGEVLDDCEANKRGERYDKEGCSYLYDIDAHIDIKHRKKSKPFVIDATKYGNVARFINHSCSPNLVNYQVLVESMDCQLAHIGLYATQDINIGEELAYDYRYKLLPGKGCPCHCGASDCRGRLY